MEKEASERNAVFTRLSLALLLYIILSLLLSLLTSLLRLEGTAVVLVQALVYAVSLSAAIFVALPSKNILSFFNQPSGFSFLKQLVIYLAVFFYSTQLNVGIGKLLAAVGIATNGTTLSFNGFGELALLFVKYVLLSSVLEEILFRGAVISSLRRYGNGFAVIVSALLFALSHTTLSAIPSAFLFGLFFGYLYIKTDSIIPSIIFHFINNLIAFVSQYLVAANSGAYAVFSACLFIVSAVAALIMIYVFIKRKGGGLLAMLRERTLSPIRFFGNYFSAAWLALAVLLILRRMETI